MRRQVHTDIAVVGAGSGGLSVAAGAAQLGCSVVLFEHGEMGGDCLNYGCVPSKALIAAAEAAATVREAERLGVHAGEPRIDFAAVMAHVRGAIAAIAPHDSQERFESLGVQVVRETARFTGPRTVESDSVRVTARKIVIATGSRPRIPPIPGLAEAPHLTNESVFELTTLPERLLVLGGGPIGLELGQAFRRLGSAVTVVEASELLGRDDPEHAGMVVDQLKREGVDFIMGKAARVEPGPTLVLEDGRRLEGSHLLVAVGREPQLDALDLDAAGIRRDAKGGLTTDRALRTSNRAVFAIGDAAGRGQFTHLAGAHASLFVRRGLFAAPVNADKLVVPRVTYTDPELAAVGLSEAEARARFGDRVRVETAAFGGNDRAIAEGDVRGGAKLVVGPGGRVLGASLVGRHAGDHVHLWTLAIGARVKLSAVAAMIAPYPTRGEINKRLAGAHFTPTLFSPRTRKLVSVLKRLA
jgi:pyruvate/2-oxoglutarate dehydrogenase complex dihydrolipoamide dehydrogenase (E3) component